MKLSYSSSKSNNLINNNYHKSKKLINRKRINSYKIKTKMNLRNNINKNNSIENKNNLNNNHPNFQKSLQVSSDNINFMKSELLQESNNNINKNMSKKFKNSSVSTNTYLIPRKSYNFIFSKMGKMSQTSINKKELTFPYGIQELDKNINNVEEIIKKLINNRFIKREFIINKITSRNRQILFEQKKQTLNNN